MNNSGIAFTISTQTHARTHTPRTDAQIHTHTHAYIALDWVGYLSSSPISPPAERRQKLFDGANFPQSGPGAGALGQVPNSEGCAEECRTGACRAEEAGVRIVEEVVSSD